MLKPVQVQFDIHADPQLIYGNKFGIVRHGH
jgi:hypothetical protein